MKRFLYALLVGTVGAGLVHVAIALLLPGAAAEKTWETLAAALPPGRMESRGLPFFAPDPFMRFAACRFDLGAGAMRLHGDGRVSAWTLSVYGQDGEALASLEDRGTPDGLLEAVVLTPAQRARLAVAAQPPVAVEVDAGEVLAVVAVFVPNATWEPASEKFLSSAACTPVP